MTPSAAVLIWSEGAQGACAWDVSLWLRLVRQFRLRGVGSIYLAGRVPDAVAVAARQVGVNRFDTSGAAALPPSAACLLADPEWVLDDLVIDQLLRRDAPVVAVTGAGGARRFAGIALLRSEQVGQMDFARGLDHEQLLGLTARGLAHAMEVERLPAYRLQLRRSVSPFTIRVDDRAAAALAEHRLLDATQKGTNDLPAQYLHPPLENALVRVLVPLHVTPNMVTVATIVVALAAAALFAGGWLMSGLLCAMAVGVLDGVDGKIARVTLTMTRTGDWFEHISDNVYEVMWYLALGAHLSTRNGTAMYTQLAWAIVVAYLLDRGVLAFWKAYREGDFHESSDWDRAFRRICGRRNNIVFLLLPFIVLGRPEEGLATVLVWWTITLLVHGFRVGKALCVGTGMPPAPSSSSGDADSVPEVMPTKAQAHGNWRDIRRGARVNFLGIVARSLRGVYLVLVARLFGSEVLGLFLLGWNAVDVVSKIGLFGLDRGLVRFLPPLGAGDASLKTRRDLMRGAMALSLGASALSTLALWWLAPWLAHAVFGHAAAVLPLRILAFGIVPLSLSQVLLSISRVERRMEYEVWTRSVIEPVLLLLFAALFWWRGWGGTGLYVAQLLALIGGFAASGWFVARQGLATLRRPSLEMADAETLWRDPAVRRMASFSAPIAAYDLIAMGVASIDFFLLARYAGPGTLGIYGAARQVSMLLKKTRQSFEPVLIPVLAQEWQKERSDAVHDTLDRVVHWILVLNVGVLLVVGLMGRQILELFGSEFGAGAATLFVLSLAHAVNGFWGVAENVVLLRRPSLNLWNWAVLALLAFVLNLLLIPKWGMEGAAISLACVFLVAALVRIWQSHRLVGWHPFKREGFVVFLVALVVALPAYGLIVSAPDFPIYRIVISAAALLAYGSGVRLLAGRAHAVGSLLVHAPSVMFPDMKERPQT